MPAHFREPVLQSERENGAVSEINSGQSEHRSLYASKVDNCVCILTTEGACDVAQNVTNIPSLVEEHVSGAGHSPLWGSARNIRIVEIVPIKNRTKTTQLVKENRDIRQLQWVNHLT